MLRRLVTNKKPLIIVTMVVALALTGLFLPAREVSIEPFGMLSIESKITISIGYEAAYAATTLARYPTIVTTTNAEAPYDDFDWLTAANVGADDGAYATITDKNFDLNIYSYRLDATNFGFTIPDGATIDGIVVEFERKNTKTSDALVRLIQGGTPSGNNNSAGAIWPLNDTIATFGNSTDKWGLTWTPALINATDDFGVAVACIGNANNAVPEIDFLRITVHYTPSITNAPTEINFGTVYISTDYWSKGSAPSWPLDDTECTFTITNLTAVAVDIDINSTHFSGGIAGGGWDIGTTADTDVVVLKAGESGIANEGLMKTLTTSDQAFIAALAGGSSTKMWELKMETPSSFNNADPKTATITLTATFSP